MITVKLYNRDGNVSGDLEFPKELEVSWKPTLVYQVVNALTANRRKPFAHTKGRSEVSGGGKKPWAQKGTGRARHGSIRSPLWKGGGTTFGPSKERNFEQKINKKMLRQALLSVLTKKATEGEMKVLETLSLEAPKTKLLARTVANIVGTHSALVVAPHGEKNIHLAARNINRVGHTTPQQVNVLDLLNHKDVLIDKVALQSLIRPAEVTPTVAKKEVTAPKPAQKKTRRAAKK